MRKALLAVLAAVALSGCHANPKYVCAPPRPAACPLPLCEAGPARPANDLTNLVLEGGGVKGVAYPGALQVLEANGVLPKIDKVAGTSAGSIAAALIALGYSLVDGGVFDNYPIELFDQDGVNPRTLGLFLSNLEAPTNPDYRIDSFPEYARNLFEALLNVQVNAFKNNPDDRKRTIIIDNLGVRTTDFDLSQELKCKLIQQGVIAACKHFAGHASSE